MTVAKQARGSLPGRDRVLDAASGLMSRRGFSGTSIAAICEKAGVGPPTIYWHFGDKEGLFAAVMERAADRWFREFVQEQEGGLEAPVPRSVAESFRQRPEFLRLLLLLAVERRDPGSGVLAAVERVRDRAKETWRDSLERLLAPIEDRAERRAAADRLSELLLVQFDGAFIACQLHPETTDLQALFELSRTGVRAAAERLVAESKDSFA